MCINTCTYGAAIVEGDPRVIGAEAWAMDRSRVEETGTELVRARKKEREPIIIYINVATRKATRWWRWLRRMGVRSESTRRSRGARAKLPITFFE